MILAENLTKYYDDFLAVDAVCLEVQAGEVLALLGPNGAGKTTTVRMLAAVLKPDRGRAWIAGYEAASQPGQVRAAIGILTENHGLYNRMPALEYLDFFGQIYRLPAPERKRRSLHLLEKFGLAEAGKRPVGEFSKGMRQKLALARALLHQPPVLLLDEPTSAMDPESARLVRDAIRDLRSADRAVILCTHNLPEAEELADRIAIIRAGRIIANNSPEALRRQFLGAAVFEARLAAGANGNLAGEAQPDGGHFPAVELPSGAEYTGSGPGWLRFASPDPEAANPVILRRLLEAGYPIVSLREVPQPLEEIYLKVMNGR